jgi:hypothetical protein
MPPVSPKRGCAVRIRPGSDSNSDSSVVALPPTRVAAARAIAASRLVVPQIPQL